MARYVGQPMYESGWLNGTSRLILISILNTKRQNLNELARASERAREESAAAAAAGATSAAPWGVAAARGGAGHSGYDPDWNDGQ